MTDNHLLGELIYCMGWIGIGAAIMYSRRRRLAKMILARLEEGSAAKAPRALPAADAPGFAASLSRLAEATGQTVPVGSRQEEHVPSPKA